MMKGLLGLAVGALVASCASPVEIRCSKIEECEVPDVTSDREHCMEMAQGNIESMRAKGGDCTLVGESLEAYWVCYGTLTCEEARGNPDTSPCKTEWETLSAALAAHGEACNIL